MTKSIFHGKVITVNIDTVTLPNGVTVDLEMVRHPGAAAVVPLKEDGTVILIRQFLQPEEISADITISEN